MSLIIGAIDFGTTYSGWAYSLTSDYHKDPTKADVKLWNSSTGTLQTEKTPTCLLVKPDGVTFQAFGYDAENQYMELTDKNEHKEYYYFRRFKMLLFNALGKDLTKDSKVKDEMGKELLAIEVFAMSIKFLSDDMMAIINQRVTGINATNVHWMLTVPAIWSDPAKQFMRQAAIKAGIATERLTIVLEPEAASLYCRHLPVNATVNDGNWSISELPTGSKYMVLDAGGGTIDITVHEVNSQCTLREVTAANGGDWGGIIVDKAFERFLIDLVGKTAFTTFKQSETEDWLYIVREFESRKREVGKRSQGKILMHFPASLKEIVENQQGSKFSVNKAISPSPYAETVEIQRDKLKISHSVVETLFEESVRQTVDHTKMLMEDDRMADVSAILMVGGYSESPLLQRALKSAFPKLKVVIPHGASSTVLRGALIFGHNPTAITERILRYTHGTNVCVPFLEGKHQESKRSKQYADVCKFVFNKLIEIDTKVKLGETQLKERFKTINKHEKRLSVDIYASREKNPTYVDDKGCSAISNIEIKFEEPDEMPGRPVNMSLLLGDTELIVELEDEKTGHKVVSTAKFWG